MAAKDAQTTISIGLLAGLGATFLSSLLWYVFSQSVDVKPLTKAVESNTLTLKGIERIQTERANKRDTQITNLTRLIYEQNRKIAVGYSRVDRIEKDCEKNTHSIKECETKHYKGKSNGY